MTDAGAPPPAARPRRAAGRVWRVGGLCAAGLAAVLALVFTAGELSGWRVLAGPAERWLSDTLDRPVHLSRHETGDFELSLWRGIRLRAASLRVDGPAWAAPEPLFEAEHLALHARWSDLIHWRRGEALPLVSLVADRLQVSLRRRADGSASWHVSGGAPRAADAAMPGLPVEVGLLWARDGRLHVADALTQTDVQVRFALREGQVDGEAPSPAPGAAHRAAALPAQGLHATATGSYRQLPVRGELHTGSLRGLIEPDGHAAPDLGVVLALSVGRARLGFDGRLRDPLGRRELLGQFNVAGPSLAAVGQPLGLTLPTTAAFDMRGRLAQSGTLWNAVVQQARIGKSQLDGQFQYDTRRAPLPTLSGRLHARTLALADLGPTIGTGTDESPKPVRAAGRVLPDRQFDLPSMRAMNANVLLQFDRLDFGTAALQSVAPLNGHLTLNHGVLRLADLDARLAQGRISGSVELDGRADRARWQAALDGRGLRLEQWIRAVQRPGGPPYASGLIGATLRLSGSGRSTADLLASADGRLALHWRQGQVSHLLVEAAGLDIAQGLGVLVRGDNPLRVSCGLADLTVRDGQVTPRAFVVDTSDSRLWVSGSLSLASERLALLARVEPKDFSPLALRAPLHIDGTLAAPQLTLDRQALAGRALPAALLAMVHPLAALIPLFDAGQASPNQDCTALLNDMRRAQGGAAVGG